MPELCFRKCLLFKFHTAKQMQHQAFAQSGCDAGKQQNQSRGNTNIRPLIRIAKQKIGGNASIYHNGHIERIVEVHTPFVKTGLPLKSEVADRAVNVGPSAETKRKGTVGEHITPAAAGAFAFQNGFSRGWHFPKNANLKGGKYSLAAQYQLSTKSVSGNQTEFKVHYRYNSMK